MPSQTLGHYLVNSLLPEKHRVDGTLTKGTLNKTLVALAKEDPKAYVDIVSKLKRLGDQVATLEGTSLGLDDIEPMYAARDRLMTPAIEAVKKAKTADEREKVILHLQDQMLNHTKEHPGSMTQMALSGARGSIPQLMKIIASPVAAVDSKGGIIPWLITKSYAEGLSSADYWVANNEARSNTIKSATSVAEPGDMFKIITNNLYPYVITQDDCGTHNGVMMSTDDGHAVGRYLAKDVNGHKRNEEVTAGVLSALRTKHPNVLVRSPMTCEAPKGICRKCQGVDEKGHPHAIGINVGVRSSSALSEPLTQFALNAKHGVRTLKGSTKRLEGISGVRQLIDVPQSFFSKATLADEAGVVSRIETAPHGGHNVYVNQVEHYVGPTLAVTVHEGQVVEAGDALSDGVPKPDEVVFHKGLGAGRAYLAATLHELYRNQGQDMDKRHTELLARSALDHIKVLEHSDKHPELLKGDVVPYNVYKASIAKHTHEVAVDQALGHALGKEVLHFTVGTPVTASLVKTLKSHGVNRVLIADDAPAVEFMMKALTRAPLLGSDWLARLAHRYLKESLVKGVHFGDVSDIHGAHPVPGYAVGDTFGLGGRDDGTY